MRTTLIYLQKQLHLTLFTRANCSLCENAKIAVQSTKREFGYGEVDILHRDNEGWKNVYEFDVPVVCVCNLRLPFWF